MYQVDEPVVISGHPEAPMENGQMITVCAHCGEMRTILFLRKDRWLCTKCHMEGVAPPACTPSRKGVAMAEIFPNEGLDLIYGGFPKGSTGPANTWLGLFTSWTASTVAGSAATAASWAEVSSAGAYLRQTISSASWGTVGTTQSGRGSAAAQVTFATATAVWGTVNGFIVTNSSLNASGVVYFGANFDDTTAVVVNTNDVIKVTPTWVYTG